MKNNKDRRRNYLKNILIPCLFLSGVAGILTGALIFLFKLVANLIIHLSIDIYAVARSNPQYILPILLGAAVLGALAYVLLRVAPECKGGGIPTAVAALRGFVSFGWVKSILVLFSSAMITFFSGVPLGNEGPSVQMGCAVGKGTVNIFAHKNKAWERYIMTGAASGGFAAATGAPLSGILFAFEEVHRRFSPIIFMAVSTATLASAATMEMLCDLTGKTSGLFALSAQPILPMKFIWIALAVGAISGIVAIFFTRIYKIVNVIINKAMARVPFLVKMIAVFVVAATLGILGAGFVGSGHSLIDDIFSGEASVWYLLIIYLLVRGIMLIVANNVGVTGGTFIPTLAFGALIGALGAKAVISIGIISSEYYALFISIGMASFLAASSRIPLTAIAFSIEALSGFGNILPIAASIALAYLIIETSGIPSFTDTVIEHKIRTNIRGKRSEAIDLHMTVQKGAFVEGKEIRDILWPPNCIVLSVKRAEALSAGMSSGDVLHLRCLTYDKAETVFLLEALVGAQNVIDLRSTHENEENYSVPEN